MLKVEHPFHFAPIADTVLRFIGVICSGRWEPRIKPQYDHLSPRERELLLQVVEGHSTKRIAWRLGMKEAVAKVKLKRLLRRIRVNNRTQAAIWALANLPELDPTSHGSVRAGQPDPA
jgi:DNA-binding CsgD family transcriptional regulator